MPVLCVLVPAFRLGVARLTDPTIDLASAVLLADKHERGRIVECTAAAAVLGVRSGVTIVQALAAARDARVVVDNPTRDLAVWAEILDALDAASPLVDDAALGCAYLDMRGIEGGAGGWIAAVRRLLAPFALPLRIALGPNMFVARAAALVADGAVRHAHDAEAFLAPLPLTVLEPGGDIVERLHALGVRTLGEIAALPHGPFVRRFGPGAARWHECARGLDPRPLRPRPRELHIDRALYGEGSAACEEQVLFALRALIGRVVEDLAVAGKRAGRLVLTLECDDGERSVIATQVAQPTAQPALLFELLRARLEGVQLHAPVVGARLAAEQLEDGGVPLTLFAAGGPDADAVGIALARLDAALGEGHAHRARVVDGARIERRFVLEPFAYAPSETPATEPVAGATELPARATLQYRIVTPTPIEVQLRGGIPRLVGSPPQAVLDVAGPWRIDEGWWGAATGADVHLVRDEYDVALEDGALVRIAREGGDWQLRGVYD
jgi:protein ImuB